MRCHVPGSKSHRPRVLLYSLRQARYPGHGQIGWQRRGVHRMGDAGQILAALGSFWPMRTSEIPAGN